MTDRFIDRARELASLERAWASGQPHLVLITGRRRVGKTALLTRFAHGKRIAYLAAAQRVKADHLVDVGRALAQLSMNLPAGSLQAVRLEDWDAALALMAQLGATEQTGVILDEFPLLAAAAPELPSLIARWWDSAGRQGHLVLVLAGSQQAAMRQLASYDGALHGRATLRPEIRPLDYFQAARFVPGWSPEDRVRAYAIAGGIPEYLRLLDDRRSLRANLRHLAFDPAGELFREAEYLFESEFREVSRRGSILRAIARGATRPSEMAKAIGIGSAADIFPNLRDLVDLGLVERLVPATSAPELRSRAVQYRIADPYLRFYFSIIEPRRSLIHATSPADADASLSAEELDRFVSGAFEDVIRQCVWRLAATGRLSMPTHVGPWWDGAEEVDVVALTGRQVLLVGEAKWQRSPMDGRDLEQLVRRTRMIQGTHEPLLLMASRAGFHSSVQPSERLLLLRPEDLFDDDLEFETRPPDDEG